MLWGVPESGKRTEIKQQREQAPGKESGTRRELPEATRLHSPEVRP